MINQNLKNYNIILGSKSPRRQELLSSLKIDFNVYKTKYAETYPKNIKSINIAEFIAKTKANNIVKKLKGNYLLITADTIVLHDEKPIHKPKDIDTAKKTLMKLSNTNHFVITGVCLKSRKKEIVFSSKTEVHFKKLTEEEINFYINKFKPFDKAGSYGIQEWIGHIGIKKIIGSYNNVVGLPTTEIYQKLKLFTKDVNLLSLQ